MMNYPNGKRKRPQTTQRKSPSNSVINFGRRGMSFEDEIVTVNNYYLASNVAVIHKKPTPVQIVKVDYPKREAAKITEAYFKTPSTTDFNGIYKGYYIDFEAKETTNKTTFPLPNLKAHQVKHLLSVAAHGGIAFLLIKFRALDEVYLLPSDKLETFWQQYDQGDRRSIKIDEFRAHCFLIEGRKLPTVDYLKVVDELISKK